MNKRRTPEQWQALLDRQQASGLSTTAFCQHENIGYASFCQWRKRLRRHEAGQPASEGAGFVDLSALMGPPPAVSPGWTLVLSLGPGVELRLSRHG